MIAFQKLFNLTESCPSNISGVSLRQTWKKVVLAPPLVCARFGQVYFYWRVSHGCGDNVGNLEISHRSCQHISEKKILTNRSEREKSWKHLHGSSVLGGHGRTTISLYEVLLSRYTISPQAGWTGKAELSLPQEGGLSQVNRVSSPCSVQLKIEKFLLFLGRVQTAFQSCNTCTLRRWNLVITELEVIWTNRKSIWPILNFFDFQVSPRGWFILKRDMLQYFSNRRSSLVWGIRLLKSTSSIWWIWSN